MASPEPADGPRTTTMETDEGDAVEEPPWIEAMKQRKTRLALAKSLSSLSPWQHSPRQRPNLSVTRASRVDEHVEPTDLWFPEPPYAHPDGQPPDVLSAFPPGRATLTYPDHHGGLASIDKINLDIIEQQSPLIAASFEESRSGAPQLHLDLLSPLTAMPFLRFLHTGSYADFDFYEDISTSLLLHCQLHHFGTVYDIPDLRAQALVNVVRQCEFACCSPDKPVDLCAAIHFVYHRHRDRDRVVDAVVNYCIARFDDHRLADDADFRRLTCEALPSSATWSGSAGSAASRTRRPCVSSSCRTTRRSLGISRVWKMRRRPTAIQPLILLAK